MLTVRLPDLTSPVAPRAGRSKPDAASPEAFGNASSAVTELGPSAREHAAKPSLFARVCQFIGQPKFWLACLTAIVVQIVLALAFAPAAPEAEPAATPPKAPAAPPRTEAARIIVPPAEPSSAKGAAPATDLLTAPQMQPAPPADAASQIEPLPSISPAPGESVELMGDSPLGPRVAEQRSLADDRQYDGQATPEAIGAKLEAVAPVDEGELQQPNGGSRE